jgi:hypothetical protein
VVSLICMTPGTPVLSMRDAVFTVSVLCIGTMMVLVKGCQARAVYVELLVRERSA